MRHVSEDNGQHVGTVDWPPDDQPLGEFEERVQFVADEIEHICQGYADGIGGGRTQQFIVAAAIDREDRAPETAIVRYLGAPDGSDGKQSTFEASEKGLLRLTMSHLEAKGRLEAMMFPSVVATLQQALKDEREVSRQLREQITSQWQTVEELRDRKEQRALETKTEGLKVEMQEKLGNEVLGMVKPLLALGMGAIGGPQLVGGPNGVPPIVLQLRDFFGGLGAKGKIEGFIQGLMNGCGLDESELMALMAIIQTIQPPEEKAAAEAAEKAAAANEGAKA